MKLKLLSLLLGVVIITGSCDDQEFGFNVSKDVGLDVPVSYTTTVIDNSLNLNPPAVTEELRLTEVEAFSDALNDLDNLGEIVVNSLSYEISGVDAAEVTPLDELTISVNASGQVIELISLTDELNNVTKTAISLTPAELAAMQSELLEPGNDLTTIVNIDFQSSPSSDVDINITVFFDITLKVRESIN